MSHRDIKISMEMPLIKDSERQRRVAGVRHGGGMPRQLLYRAGKLFVDLHVQTQPASPDFVVAGQILSGEEDSSGFSDRQIDLEFADGTLVTSRTSDTGEFLLTCPPQRGGSLEVSIEDWLSLELALPSDALAGREDASS